MDQNTNIMPQASDSQFSDNNQISDINKQREDVIISQPQQIQQSYKIEELNEIEKSGDIGNDANFSIGNQIKDQTDEQIDKQNIDQPIESAVIEEDGENQEESIHNKYKDEEESQKNKYKLRRHHESVFLIEVEKIKSNPFQPRKHFDENSLKELAASIREFGIIQPIIVSKIEHEVEDGTKVEYQLIAGERRLMAAKMIGMERVPAIVRRVSQKAEQMELAIVENLQRANLNPVETARAYARLQDEFGLTQREIAVRLGKSRESIANNLRILNLPTEIQEAVIKNQINESQARLLLAIDDMAQQMAIFNELIKNNLSVRELRGRIKIMAPGNKPLEASAKQASVNPEIFHFQEQLTELIGAPVKIESTKEGGKIVISFYSPEEIQGIIQKLNPKI